MDPTAFEAKLKADGFDEIETKRLDPRPANGEHGHHFGVRGLVLEGTFIVTKEGVEHAYKPGEIFEVPMGCMHFEEVPAEGAKVLIGRKH